MIKQLFTLLLVCGVLSAFSQTSLNKIEYFFDTDPGPGNGIVVGFSNTDSASQSFAISTSGIAVGWHTLYFRYGDNGGKWGNTTWKLFQVTAVPEAKLVAGEYYFDTDPGPGNGTVFTTAVADSVSDSLAISTVGLSVGYHTLFLRYKDIYGKWGNTSSKLFNVATAAAQTLVAGEYFIDTDPGVGNATPFSGFSAADSVTNTISESLTAYADGKHTLYTRYKNSYGQWGNLASDTFNICGPILPITGNANVCMGATITLADASAGGTWSSGATGIATVGTSGIVTGVSAGTAVITYMLSSGCKAMKTVTVTALTPITGTTVLCAGDTTTLLNATPGGTWTSNTTARATVGSASGYVAAVLAATTGTVTISYTYSVCVATKVLTVNALPTAFSGSASICIGDAATWTTSPTGGTWSSSNTSVATVGSTGTVAGIGVGTANITYTTSVGCRRAKTVTVNAAISPITADAFILCAGNTLSMSSVTSEGTWSSSNTARATIGSTTGIVSAASGATTGTATITYTVGNCFVTRAITVNAISGGTTSICVAATTTWASGGTGGTWTSSTPSVATVGTTGLVTGIVAGSATISYTYTTGCSAIRSVSVNPLPGTISVPSAIICAGSSVGLSCSPGGGTWSSSSTSRATVDVNTGVVTGVTSASTGTVRITYAIGPCITTTLMTVNALPAAISGGATSICIGGTTTWTSSGGTWSSGSPSVATVGSTGIVTGISAGTAEISYTLPTGCSRTRVVTVNAMPTGISGPSVLCAGSDITLTGDVSGGTWSSSNTARATVGSSSGIVSGVVSASTGTVTITYNMAGCGTVAKPVTVNALPAAIAGGSVAICAGATTTWTNSTSGGTWSSGSTAVATVGSTGIVTGMGAGAANISYTLSSTGCARTRTITVDTVLVAAEITGPAAVCPDSTIVLSTSMSGGSWSTDNSLIATVDGAGIVTGMMGGSCVISYSLSNTCGTAISTVNIMVGGLPDADTITGTSSICEGSTTTLSVTVSGGSWSSSNTSVAAVGSTGIVTGVAAGTATISYTVTNSCGTASATKVITVNALPDAGTITGSSTFCAGSDITLANTVPAGSWSSSNTSVATIGSTGIVTGVAAGTATISYTVTNSCGTASAIKVVTVNPLPTAGSITGPSSVNVGSAITLSNSVSGGTWSSSNTSVATVGSTGVVTGMSAGSAVISYTVSNGCGTVAATFSVSATSDCPVIISTVAGRGLYGHSGDGGSPLLAGFTGVNSVATDRFGNLYIAEQTYVRKVSVSGVITTVAGNGSSSFSGDGGPATSAGVYPLDIAVDTAGNLFIADYVNSRIRKVNLSGTISTVAGNGSFTFSGDGGAATASAVAYPTGVAVSREGELFITDFHKRVKKVNTAGIVTTIAGNGTATYAGDGGAATAASFSNPRDVAVDASGNVYVTDGSDQRVRKVTPSGIITTFAGTGVGGFSGDGIPATAAQIYAASGLEVDREGNVLIADYGNHRIRIVNALGVITTLAGNGTAGFGGDGGAPAGAILDNPARVAVDTAGNIYIADGDNGRIRRVGRGAAVGAVSGASTLMVGDTVVLTDSVSGGTWSSSSSTVATVSSGGIVTGMSAGTAVIFYAVTNSCGTTAVTKTLTVNAILSTDITGTLSVCEGSTTDLDNVTSGGVWSSSALAVATINSSTGVVSGLSAGTATISYTVPGGIVSAVVTVNPLPVAGSITGADSVQADSAIMLAGSPSGGTWVSSNGGVATVGSTGTVTGVGAGTAIIYYIVANSCGADTVLKTVTVTPAPACVELTGATGLCISATVTLSPSVSGGTWSSSTPSVATVGSATGVVTGVSNGIATITYSLPGGCRAVKVMTVGLAPITGTPYVCIGTTTELGHPVSGGTWSIASSYYATVNATSGVVTGVHSGGTTVTYTLGSGCYATASVYTSNVILNITGSLNVCEGSTSALSTPGYPGGTWSTPDSATAFINATTGVLLGISAGTVPVTITYGYCYTSAIATVNPVPASISGGSAVCAGSTLALSCSTGGGAWSSSNTAKATVNSSGVVTGVAPGTATIYYTIGTGCAATKIVSVGAMPASIAGTTTVCVGSTTNLACTTLGGTWSSSATGTADVVSGTVTATTSYTTISGVATGGATISYSMPTGCVQTVNVTVATPPSAIGGTLAICSGGSSTLTSSGGGTWSSSLTTVATIGSATGIVTGGSTTGTATITYRTSATCYTTAVATVTTPSAISGPASVCKTYTVTLTHGTGGGTWSSSNTAVATVDATTGVVTGVVAGAVNITYNISTGCYAVKSLQVYNNPSAIAGASTLCAGAVTALTNSTSGAAIWSSSNTAVATIGSATGSVSGVSAGNTDITYTTTATGCYTVKSLTVNETPSGITGATAICVGADEMYMSTPTGGTWSSTSPTVGSINATSGTATGRAGGGTTIKYLLSSGCYVTKAITVNALPVAITGTTLLCVGNNVVLASTTSGATWSTSAAGTASITATTATTATVAGISNGMANISYTNAAGCSRVAVVTVNDAVASIEGPDVICSGNSVTYIDATSGGAWGTSASAKVNIVAGTGVATGGTTVGSAVITYKTSAACFAIKYVTNNAAVANITGTTSICVGATTTFLDATSGGTWSSSGTIATVDATTGVITGMSGGTNIISYIVSEGCYKTKAITVKALPTISGADMVSVGATTPLSGSPTAGAWSSGTTATATINVYGIVSGVAAGSVTISYYAGGCYGTWPMTVGVPSSRPAGMTENGVAVFSVFPNPTHGSLSVNTGVAGTFVIYTVDGKLASTSELTEGVNAISMPVGVVAGTYLCRFQGVDGSVQAVRLVYEP